MNGTRFGQQQEKGAGVKVQCGERGGKCCDIVRRFREKRRHYSGSGNICELIGVFTMVYKGLQAKI